MKIKILFLAIAAIFLASQVSAYYYWGGSYGALEYPNSYYNYTYSGASYGPSYGYDYYYNFTPYSTYSYYSSWQPYATYYEPVYYTYPAYYSGYDKEFYWSGFGFNFAYLH
ncbi:MAG: hypothetical protein PHD95_00880 [Candidatus ainarchaeum sp.]|nr:hypothetical protein [Candidatus ainarchaeum sp.]